MSEFGSPIGDPERSSQQLKTRQEQARELLPEGKYAEAEDLLKQGLTGHERESSNNVHMIELSRVLFWRGKPTESKGYLEQVLQNNPRESWAVSFLGQVEARMGNHDRAQGLFEQALTLDPENHEAKLFLHGDTMDQAIEARGMLTHGALSPEDRRRFAELSQAIDFKRRRTVDLEQGEITQQSFDRMNLMLDLAQVGEEVDSELSLRGKFDEAQEVVYYTSHAFGDAVLGVNALQAMIKYFEAHPEKRKPINIVTPFSDVFQGFSEQHDFIRVKQIGKPTRNPDEPKLIAADLKERKNKVFVMTNSGNEATSALLEARGENATAVVDMFIDRFSRDRESWRETTPPYQSNTAYPGKMFRFMEMALGEKLAQNPILETNKLPLSQDMIATRDMLTRKYNLTGTDVHTFIESASTIAKKFSQEQLRDILTEMAKTCAEQAKTGQDAKIFFVQDPGDPNSYANKLWTLPKEVRDHITIFKGTLGEVGALASLSESLLTPDTGIAHQAASLGTKALVLYTMADPYLWNAGGDNVDFLAAPQALTAHENRTPVNMIQWSDQEPITQTSFTVAEIIGRWKRLWQANKPTDTGARPTGATFVGP